MAAPVWILSVDLQTKTASFSTGLADAAKNARGAFQDIKSGSNEMGTSVGYSMTEARHGVMLLGEEFGVHLPRALTSFIAGLGPIGAAMDAAFPFLAIAVGATLLIQHLEKMREAGLQLTQDQMKFGTTVDNVWNSLDQKILQAQIRADDLNHNHLAALDDQLKLIDRESMDELVHSFEEVAKAGDVVMKELESHWYSYGTGSEGAKHALDDFKVHYDMLLAAGKQEQASGLLHGTQQQAQSVLGMLQQAQGSVGKNGGGGDYNKFEEAKNKLRQLGVTLENTTTASLQKQIEAQQNLVDVLNSQVGSEERIAQLKSLQGGNAKTEDKQKDAQAAKERERQLQEALKGGRDLYLSELFQQYRDNVTAVQQGEKEQIDATKQGTAERLSAINEAMLAERQMGLENTAFYRQLQLQEIETQRQMDEGGTKSTEDMVKEKMSALRELAQEEARHIGAMSKAQVPKGADDYAEKQAALQQEYTAKHTELMQEFQDAQLMGTQRVALEQKINDQSAALDKKHQDQVAELAKQEAQTEKQARLEVANAFGQSLLQVAEGHTSMARVAETAFQSMISNSLKAALTEKASEETSQLAHAKSAAAAAGHAVANIPIVGPALAIVAAGATFAAMMAFEEGGIVPGVGRGDIVPAMLTPGEGVVPGMGGGGHTYHLHVRPTYHVQTIDGDGMQDALEKHSDQLQRHIQNTLRKMNH